MVKYPIQAKLEPFPPVSEKNVTQCPWALYVSQPLILAICRNSPRVKCMMSVPTSAKRRYAHIRTLVQTIPNVDFCNYKVHHWTFLLDILRFISDRNNRRTVTENLTMEGHEAHEGIWPSAKQGSTLDYVSQTQGHRVPDL